MTTFDKLLLSGMLVLIAVQGSCNTLMLMDMRTVQLSSAKAQIASGNLDKEVAEMLMRIDKNTRKGN